MASWTNDYIYIPFKEKGRSREDGIDCYGLIRLYAADRDLAMPNFGEGYADSNQDLRDALRLEKAGRVEIGEELEGDILLFINKLHVGIVVRPGTMLHCTYGVGVAIERYRNAEWTPRLKTITRLPTR